MKLQAIEEERSRHAPPIDPASSHRPEALLQDFAHFWDEEPSPLERRSSSRHSSTASGKTAASSSPSGRDRRSSATSKRPNNSTASAQTGGVSIAGATGLEPATSGVTGRLGHDDASRQTPLSRRICRHLSQQRNILPAWLSQSPNRCLGHEWATEACLRGQRHADARGTSPALCAARRGDAIRPPIYHALRSRCRGVPAVAGRRI